MSPIYGVSLGSFATYDISSLFPIGICLLHFSFVYNCVDLGGHEFTFDLIHALQIMSVDTENFASKILSNSYDSTILDALKEEHQKSQLERLFATHSAAIENKLLVAESDVQNIDRDVKKHALHNYHLFIEAASCVNDTETAARQLHHSLAQTRNLTNKLVNLMATPLTLPTLPAASSSLSQAHIQLQHAALMPEVIFSALRSSSLPHVIALWKKFATMLAKAFTHAHTTRQYSPLLFSLLLSLIKTRKAINLSRLSAIRSHLHNDAVTTQALLWEPLAMPSAGALPQSTTTSTFLQSSTSLSTSMPTTFTLPSLYPRAVLAATVPDAAFPQDMQAESDLGVGIISGFSRDMNSITASTHTASSHIASKTTESLESLSPTILSLLYLQSLCSPLSPPAQQTHTLVTRYSQGSANAASSDVLQGALLTAIEGSYEHTRSIVETAVTTTTFTNRLCAYAMNKYLNLSQASTASGSASVSSSLSSSSSTSPVSGKTTKMQQSTPWWLDTTTVASPPTTTTTTFTNATHTQPSRTRTFSRMRNRQSVTAPSQAMTHSHTHTDPSSSVAGSTVAASSSSSSTIFISPQLHNQLQQHYTQSVAILTHCAYRAPNLAVLHLLLSLLKQTTVIAKQFNSSYPNQQSLLSSAAIHSLLAAVTRRQSQLLDAFTLQMHTALSNSLNACANLNASEGRHAGPSGAARAVQGITVAHSILKFAVRQLDVASQRFHSLNPATLDATANASVNPEANQQIASAPFLHARADIMRCVVRLLVTCVAQTSAHASVAITEVPAVPSSVVATPESSATAGRVGGTSSVASISAALRSLAKTLVTIVEKTVTDLTKMISFIEGTAPSTATTIPHKLILSSESDGGIVQEYFRNGTVVMSAFASCLEAQKWAEESKEALDVIVK